MNIYKVTRISKIDYDTYSSFICFAESETQAKNLNPSHPGIYSEKFKSVPWINFFMDWENNNKNSFEFRSWVKNVEDLEVVLIGTGVPYIGPGIILASYHAG